MNQYHTTSHSARIRRAGSVCLILAVIISLLPAVAPQPAGAQGGNPVPVQTFYVPWPESQLLQGLQAIESGGPGANPGGAQIWGDGNTADGAPPGVLTDVSSAGTEILYPTSDLKIGLWYEGVPGADPDNFRFNEIDDPAPANDGDATYIVTTGIKSYQAGIAVPTVPADATNISVSIIWTVRYEVPDTFHVSWSQLGVNGKYHFGPRHNPGTTYTTYTDTWTNNPHTGSEWTPAAANTVNGLGFDSNVKSAVHITQAYIQISYEMGSAASIDVEKYIWDGTAWVDADELTGPYLLPGTDPQFKFVVANTGNVDLSNVDLTDNVYGNISLDGTLAAGTSAEYFVTGTWAAGQHTNTATATGDYGGNTYTDSDDANYFGSSAAPAIDVEKYIWGVTAWVDADTGLGPIVLSGTDPQFKFVVTNNGNVTLGSIGLSDEPAIANFYADQELTTACVIPTSLDPQATFTCYGSLPWAKGGQTDISTATGDFGGNPYTDSDAANYYGGAPAIDVEKYVWDGTAWVDADTAPGPNLTSGTDPQFKFVVTNTGNLPLSNVAVTDNVFGNISSGGTLSLRASAEYIFIGTWTEGQHTNTATATATFGGNPYTDSDDANYYGAPPAPALRLVKTASPATYGSVGDVIVYNYQLTNSGEFALDAPFTVTDDKVSVTCPETPASLVPGDSIICTASYIITLSDLNAGSVTNTAQGHGYYGDTPVDSNYDDETATANESQLGTPTSTCASLRDRLIAGTSLEQTQILYIGGDTILNIWGGTIHWTRFNNLSGNVFHMAVQQTITSAYGFTKYLGVRQLPTANVALYDSNCRLVTGTITAIEGGTIDDATFSFTFTASSALSGGPYFLQVRYDHALLKNQPIGSSYPDLGQTLAHYDFATLLEGTVVARDSSGSYTGGYGGLDLKR